MELRKCKKTIEIASLLACLVPMYFFDSQGSAIDLSEGKAAKQKIDYLRYLAEFTTWPAGRFKNEKTPITIGLVGDDPDNLFELMTQVTETEMNLSLERTLKFVAIEFVPKKRPSPKAIPVKNTPRKIFEQKLRNCNVVFCALPDSKRLADVRKVIEREPILMISERKGFASSGGMVEFLPPARPPPASGEIPFKFRVNLESVHKSDLNLSSWFLSLKHVEIIGKPAD